MKKNNSLADDYYVLINDLPRLSQDEIVALYESENIPYTDLELEIKEIEDKMKLAVNTEELETRLEELKKKEKPSVAYRYFLTVLGRKCNIRRYPSLELRNKIVEGTMYLVVINAKKICKLEENKLSFDDLFQYGMEALLSAAYYYVPGGTAKFETYASKCIKNKMLKMMNDSCKTEKRNCKAEKFFEKERLKIKELELLLETEKCCVGGYMSDTADHLIVHRLNRKIVHYNQDKDKRMEHNQKIRKVYGKSIDDIFERYRKLLKSSKLNALITDAERRDIEAVLSYKGYEGVELIYYRSQYYLNLYKYKIDLLEKYIAAENELIKKGEVASLENIIGVINSRVRETNKKISDLKKSNFFENCKSKYMKDGKFIYKPLKSFFEEYLEIYDVCLFDEFESNESRASEKYFIASDYEDICEEYDYYIEELRCEDSEEVYVYYDEDERIVQIISYVPFSELDDSVRKRFSCEEEYYYSLCYPSYAEAYSISRNELLNRLIKEQKELGSKEDYVKKVLKKKAAKVNKSLQIKNAPIIKENIRIREMEDLYRLGERYHQYLKKRDMKVLSENINLLYDDDPELLDLLLEKDKTKKRRLTVEEKVSEIIFLEDYNDALNDLSSLQREIMELYLDEIGCKAFTLKQIADILGITLNKVKMEKSKALKKLRENEKLISYYNES